MRGVFEPWIGLPVVLQVTLGQFKLRLLGKVLREQGETLLMRPQCGPDVEISKTKVLAIEECASLGAHAGPLEYGSLEEGVLPPHRPSNASCPIARLSSENK